MRIPFFNSQTEDQKRTALVKEMLVDMRQLTVNRTIDIERLKGAFAGISGGPADDSTLHNIFADFGYPLQLTPVNFWNMYRRFGVARAIIQIPPNVTWVNVPDIESDTEQFVTEFEALMKRLKGWERFKGVDTRQRVGRYGALIMIVGDGKTFLEPMEPLQNAESLRKLLPVYESQLEVSTYNDDETSERFGLPITYTYNSNSIGSRNENSLVSTEIHWTRVITTAEGADDGGIYGIPALESIYNDLMDLRKIAGAGGEGLYQNTRSAPIISPKEGFAAPKTTADKDAMNDEIDDFLQKWQKKFVTTGLEFTYPDITLSDVTKPAEVTKQNICAGESIPTKLVFGNQQGNLASEEDLKFFYMLMNSRREHYASGLIRDFVDWCIEYGVLPPVDEYEIEWDDLLELSPTDKAALAKTMSETNKNNFTGGGGLIYSEDEIREATDHEAADFEQPSEELDEGDFEE